MIAVLGVSGISSALPSRVSPTWGPKGVLVGPLSGSDVADWVMGAGG